MLLILAAGISLAADVDFALRLLAPAVIALVLLAIVNSWTLTFVGTGDGGDASHARGEDHRRTPRRQHRGGDRAAHRPDPPRRRDRHHGVPAVRAARGRPGGRPDVLVRRPQRRCSSTTRTPRTTRTSAAGPRATGRSTRVPGTASRTTSTSSASAGRAMCCSARTATRRWPARSGCSRSGREQRRWRSRWPASRTCSSGRGSPASSCAAGCSPGCSRRTSCSSCSGGATSAAAEV